MRTIVTLLLKDLRLFLRDRVAFSLTFLVPAVLIYIFGHVFGVSGSSQGPGRIPLAIVNESNSDVATAIVAALEQEETFRLVTTAPSAEGIETPLTESRARELIHANQLRFALVLPADLENPEGPGLQLRFLSNPRNEIETQMVNGLLQKAVFTSAPQALLSGLRRQAEAVIGRHATSAFYRNLAGVIARSFGGSEAEILEGLQADRWLPDSGSSSAGSGGAGAFFNRLVRFETEQVQGQAVKSPAATRSVGGWAVMFLLFSVSGAATSLFDEKRAGLFQRLLAAPVRRSHVLWSKHLFCVLLGMVQLLALFGAGRVLFGIDVTSNLGNLLLVVTASSLACTAFGMLLAAVSRSPAAAQGLATFLVLTMSAVGGAWFPVSLMPDFIQQLSKLTIVYWSMEGFLAVLWAGHGWREVLPIVGVLAGFAAVINVISLWRFNRGAVFD